MGILAVQVRQRETEIPDASLKDLHTDSLAHRHTPGASRGTEAQEMQESYGERLHYMEQE